MTFNDDMKQNLIDAENDYKTKMREIAENDIKMDRIKHR